MTLPKPPPPEAVDRITVFGAKRRDRGFVTAIFREPQMLPEDISDTGLVERFPETLTGAA